MVPEQTSWYGTAKRLASTPRGPGVTFSLATQSVPSEVRLASLFEVCEKSELLGDERANPIIGELIRLIVVLLPEYFPNQQGGTFPCVSRDRT